MYIEDLFKGLIARIKRVFFSSSPTIDLLALLIMKWLIMVRPSSIGNKIKNIMPTETGNTIAGTLPERTSEAELIAKDVTKLKRSAIGLLTVLKVIRERSILISTYFSKKRLYVDIKTSMMNQK